MKSLRPVEYDSIEKVRLSSSIEPPNRDDGNGLRDAVYEAEGLLDE